MKSTLYITAFLFLFCTQVAAQENPLMKMAGKKYNEYSADFFAEFGKIIENYDTVEVRKFQDNAKEVAQKTGDVEWKLLVEWLEISLIKMYKNYGTIECSQEDIIRKTLYLTTKAQKEGAYRIELFLLDDVIEAYCFGKKYELAIEQCDILNKRLQQFSQEEVPEKSRYYQRIAAVYYTFKDYPKVIYYLEKILSEKKTAANQWQQRNALNDMGLCYRRGFNDLERSDSYFREVLNYKFVTPYDDVTLAMWEGLAEGNLGRNKVLRGEYDSAVALLKSSIPKMIRYKDYGYAISPAINLAIIYLKKGNLPEAKRYIDSATAYYAKERREAALPLIYEIKSKYYAAIGNAKFSADYLDSLLMENKKNENEYSTLLLMRVAERKHLSEQQLKNEQLNAEIIKSKGYRRSFIIAFVGLLAAGSLLMFYLILYRKKKNAYHALVHKSQEWAAATDKQNDGESDISEEDRLLFHQLHQIFQTEHLYRNPNISISAVAQQMNVNRTYLSRAINRCTGNNFNTFVNEYRIKEAILIMSNEVQKFSFEGLAYETGFNDRKTFYTAFKKITGLSPSEFRQNVENEDENGAV
jgi:AraC-like DNA-binding protein